MAFEELSPGLIKERMDAIRAAPYRLLMEEVDLCVRYERVSKERKRTIRMLKKKAQSLDAILPDEPVGMLERALTGTGAEELHERLSRTNSCIFIGRSRTPAPLTICERYAQDLGAGTELLFGTFDDATTYARAFHARTKDGPQLFFDVIEGGVFSWSKLDDWRRTSRIPHLMTNIAGSTLLMNDAESGIVLAEDETAEFASVLGYRARPVFDASQTNRTYGTPQRSHRIGRPATDYRVMPRSHLAPLTIPEIDSFTQRVLPYLSKSPMGDRVVITEAYANLIKHASENL